MSIASNVIENTLLDMVFVSVDLADVRFITLWYTSM